MRNEASILTMELNFHQKQRKKKGRSWAVWCVTKDATIFGLNLIAFFSRASLNPNSIASLLVHLHSQNPNLHQNQNPWFPFSASCFPAIPRFHQRIWFLFLYLYIYTLQFLNFCYWVSTGEGWFRRRYEELEPEDQTGVWVRWGLRWGWRRRRSRGRR